MLHGFALHASTPDTEGHECPRHRVRHAPRRPVAVQRDAGLGAGGTSLAEKFDGFLGSGWVRPSADSTDWHMLYRFADADSLAAWEASPQRAWWLEAAQGSVEEKRRERRTGIEGWFDVPASSLLDRPEEPGVPAAPARWKQAVTIWLGFFPTNLVFSLLVALLPVWGAVPLALRVLITTVVLTPVMTYLVLPFVTARLRPWLERGPGSAPRP